MSTWESSIWVTADHWTTLRPESSPRLLGRARSPVVSLPLWGRAGWGRVAPFIRDGATARIANPAWSPGRYPGLSLAPEPGFEPGTVALTARCSTVELLRSATRAL